jgi:hypothetical protein
VIGGLDGRIASRQSLLDSLSLLALMNGRGVNSSLRDPLIATRASRDKRDRFAALARARDVSMSALLLQLIDRELETADVSIAGDDRRAVASDRVSLRLRPGDRALVDERARARKMKPASYLVALIRAHVRAMAPLPAAELDALKVTTNQLRMLRSQLQAIAQGSAPLCDGDRVLGNCLRESVSLLGAVRREVADVVRINLVSWEAGDG